MANIFESVKAGYHEFKEQFKLNMQFYKRLSSEGQNPFVMYIGCSDSRVIPEKMLNLSEGDVFVIRNVANIIPPKGSKDTSVAAALEFAVQTLKIEQIIVCGHTDCGGINSLAKGADMQKFSNIIDWVEYARPVLEEVSEDEDDRVGRLIRKNVLLQKQNLLTYPFIRERYEQGALEIHPWLYDLDKGDIRAYSYSTGRWEPI